MFPTTYFAATYWPGTYFAEVGAAPPPATVGKAKKWFPGLMRRPRPRMR